MKTETKQGKILAHLKDGKSITQQDAIRLYSHFRLAVAINRFRKAGYDIETKMRKSMFGEPYAEYKLIEA